MNHKNNELNRLGLLDTRPSKRYANVIYNISALCLGQGRSWFFSEKKI